MAVHFRDEESFWLSERAVYGYYSEYKNLVKPWYNIRRDVAIETWLRFRLERYWLTLQRRASRKVTQRYAKVFKSSSLRPFVPSVVVGDL